MFSTQTIQKQPDKLLLKTRDNIIKAMQASIGDKVEGTEWEYKGISSSAGTIAWKHPRCGMLYATPYWAASKGIPINANDMGLDDTLHVYPVSAEEYQKLMELYLQNMDCVPSGKLIKITRFGHKKMTVPQLKELCEELM